MRARCICGAVTVRLGDKPTYINDCNCTLCRKSGAAWGYFPAAAVTIEGDTKGVTRNDMEAPAVEVHFCPRCGAATHWELTQAYTADHPQADRVGVNMKLFDPATLAGIELRFPDGLGWSGDDAPRYRRDASTIATGFSW
jgi:hypothetical protein